jgi:hypothetical protein
MRPGRGDAGKTLEGDGAFGGVFVLAEEEGGVADGSDAGGGGVGLDLSDEGGAFVAVGTFEADFHEFAGFEEAGELALEGGGEAGFADLEGGVEGLAEAAEVGLLRAGEGDSFHVWGHTVTVAGPASMPERGGVRAR